VVVVAKHPLAVDPRRCVSFQDAQEVQEAHLVFALLMVEEDGVKNPIARKVLKVAQISVRHMVVVHDVKA
jgi:hypothetical protein